MTESNKTSDYSRREFLGNSARNAAGVAVGVMGFGATTSATERLQFGVIGLGAQGLETAQHLSSLPGVQIVAICDVDASKLAIAQEQIGLKQRTRPIALTAHEQLLARPDLDAVVIASPDHWHARIATEAAIAGKDFYLETPLAHSIAEGDAICRTARDSQRIAGVGLPQRSGPHFRSAVQLIQSGFLGQIHQAKGWAVHRRRSIGRVANSTPPPGVDYDRWLGPAEKRPFNSNRFHQHWPWFWEYGSGELGLWGVQHLDFICWALNLNLPSRITAMGGRRSFDDDRETPDTLSVQFEYPHLDVQWEHRQWSNRGIEGRTSGVAIYGDLGTLVIDRSGWKVYDHRQSKVADYSEFKLAHLADFVDAVRHRRTPNATLADANKSSTLCHLGNLAYRMGREIRFNANSKTVIDDPQANAMLLTQARSPWQLMEESCQPTS